jgi:hypothetical protein
MAGDFDLDGRVADGDYARWKQSFGTVSLVSFHAADGNRDGVVDSADYSVWRSNLGRIAGDFDGSGVVDEGDYAFWKSNFGATQGAGLAADGNGDGRVDGADFTVWRNARQTPAAAAGQASIAATAGPESTSELASPANASRASQSEVAAPTATQQPTRLQPGVGLRGGVSPDRPSIAVRARSGAARVASDVVALERGNGLLLALDRRWHLPPSAAGAASPFVVDRAFELFGPEGDETGHDLGDWQLQFEELDLAAVY